MPRAGALVGSIAVATIVVLFFLPGEEEARAQTPLARAIEMVRRASSETYLRRNGVFLALDVPHDVAHWVGYFFSPLSTGQWAFEGGLEDFPIQRNDLVVPKGIHLLPSNPGELPSELRERSEIAALRGPGDLDVLVSADREKDRVVVRVFAGGKDELVHEEAWDFPPIPD